MSIVQGYIKFARNGAYLPAIVKHFLQILYNCYIIIIDLVYILQDMLTNSSDFGSIPVNGAYCPWPLAIVPIVQFGHKKIAPR